MTQTQFRHLVGGFALSFLALSPAAAYEDDYDTESEYQGLAVAIDRQLPASPRHRKRKMQAAWVLLNYVVTADGRAIDPIIVNSSGGIDFENEVRKVIDTWRFEESVTGAELPYNAVTTRFTMRGRGKGTTRTFARHSLHIMKNLQRGNIEKARGVADEAVRLGGWNLYESTILWLMLGRIEGEEGDEIEQLEMYKRGLAVSDERSLRHEGRRDLLEDIFELQSKLGHFAESLRTYAALAEVPGSEEVVERHKARATEIALALDNDDVVTARAAIANPCDCEGGVPLWSYTPLRRTFSFANVGGGVGDFEARCERQRIRGTVVPGQKWTLADDWGYCEVFVFGKDGATFDFLGHLHDDAPIEETDETAVASNHVLDRRSRRQ